jgi:hypothetical protein
MQTASSASHHGLSPGISSTLRSVDIGGQEPGGWSFSHLAAREYVFEPVSAKTQPVSDLPTPEFRILKIHRAETGPENLRLLHEVPDVPCRRPVRTKLRRAIVRFERPPMACEHRQVRRCSLNAARSMSSDPAPRSAITWTRSETTGNCPGLRAQQGVGTASIRHFPARVSPWSGRQRRRVICSLCSPPARQTGPCRG